MLDQHLANLSLVHDSRVTGIPTLLVFKDGQVKELIVGYVPKEQIQKALDKHVG